MARLPIREYADRDGISEITVRRWIKRGELERLHALMAQQGLTTQPLRATLDAAGP